MESIEIGTLLLNLGCQLAQGYAIAHPMPAEELPQWLNQFEVPVQWQHAKNSVDSTAEYSITLMYLNHHRIVSRVRHAIEQKMPSLIPEYFQEGNACEIGKWLEGEGRQHYSQFKEFKLLFDKHHKIHELIKYVSLLLNEHGDEEILQRTSMELNQLSSELLDCLNHLRRMIMKESSSMQT